MSGFRLGIGLGLSYVRPCNVECTIIPTISVISTGKWLYSGIWNMNDIFKF